MQSRGMAKLVAIWALVSLFGCREEEYQRAENSVNNVNNTNNANNVVPSGKTLGEACAGDEECRTGLGCVEEICAFKGETAEGSPCLATGECAEGLYCDALAGLCMSAGDAQVGDGCGGTAQCAPGLVCQPRGLSGVCVEGGTVDVGGACASSAECLPGLGCADDPFTPEDASTVCLGGLAGLPVPWAGVECAENDEEGPFRVYFEVPDGEVAEFYRLPFPNDIRLKNGKPDLSSHPTPGDGILGFDIVQKYIDAIEANQDGFGPNQAVQLRFSNEIDFASVVAGGDDTTRNVWLMDIDPDSPGYGSRLGLRWAANSGRSKYMCQNRMIVRTRWGVPLRPETTYAVIFTSGMRSTGGAPLQRDADFDALMASARPDGVLGDAWDAYAPLRDWLADDSSEKVFGATDVMMASVFTIGNPLDRMAALSAAARTNAATNSGLTTCEAGTTSPCDDGLEGDEHVRGCFDADLSGDWHELHGKLALPIFQSGEAPYMESGGMASPAVARTEDVCMAMTVPASAAMPTNGYPVVIYAPGTGGNFRNNVRDLAPSLSGVSIDQETVPFITMSWEQVLHGARRNGSDTHPNELVYNYANPDAAMGNFLQGAAEIHAVIAWLENFSIPAESSPTGSEIVIDTDNIYFFGHSQGGTTGPLALPFDQTVKGSVLSGAGAGLALALTKKTSPVDSPTALQFVLQESGITENHPIINLFQGYFEPVDPINFAGPMAASPVDGVTYPSHVFHTNGIGDTYTPPEALDAMAIALRATYIAPLPQPIDGVPTGMAPFSGNVTHDMVPFTVAGRQYEPTDYDGHFVVFRNQTAVEDVQEFLGTAVTAGVPEIR